MSSVQKSAPAPRDVVVAAATALHFLEADGTLSQLDSLAVVDLVLEIESRLGVRVPLADLDQDVFRTLESVEAMVATLVSAGAVK